MSHCDHQGGKEFTENFWFYKDTDNNQPGRGAMKLGFLPSNEFQAANDQDKLLKYFNLEVWCRTGKALEGIEPQTNLNGDAIWPGAVLDFNKRPINTYPDWMLATNWLTA